MRIGTWNLRLCPTSTSTSERGQAIAAWMDAQAVDVWLLTEVHRDWAPRDGHLVVSPRRSDDVECKRWAAIESKLPMSELTTGDSPHPGDEGLVLARLALDGTSVLVACSVLPWKGAAKYWNGLPPGQFDQWRFVLDHHAGGDQHHEQGRSKGAPGPRPAAALRRPSAAGPGALRGAGALARPGAGPGRGGPGHVGLLARRGVAYLYRHSSPASAP